MNESFPKSMNNWVFKRGGPIRIAVGDQYVPAQGEPGVEAARKLIELFNASGQALNERDQRRLEAAKSVFGIATAARPEVSIGEVSTEVNIAPEGPEPQVTEVSAREIVAREPSFHFQNYWQAPASPELPVMGRPDDIQELSRRGSAFPVPPPEARFGGLGY